MKAIAREAKENPEAVHACPVTTPVGRPDEVTAARKPVVRYTKYALLSVNRKLHQRARYPRPR